MRKGLTKINFFFLLAIIVYIPFQSLAAEILSSFGLNSSLVFWVSHFYEPILLILALISFIIFLTKKISAPLIYLVLAILLLGLCSFLWSHDIGRSLEGFRFTLLFLAGLFVAMVWPFSQEEKNKLGKVFILVSLIVALGAILERFLPSHYWQMIGLSYDFGYGNFMVGNFFRSLSFLGGPNQLGSYLLPAFFIALFNLNKLLSSRKSQCFVLITLFLGIFLSMSRAAFIGLAFGLLIYIISVNIKRWKILLTVVFGLSLLILFSYQLYNSSLIFKDFIIHGQSQFLHLTALQSSWQYFKELDIFDKIFGIGLGTAGPLAVKYGEGIVSESWFFQIIFEMGVAGFILWLTLFVLILIGLVRKKMFGLFYALISVIITSLFLHTLADNPALSYSLFILIGLSLNHTKYEENTN